jgi:polyhydroxybutyrate depolymerase
VGSRGVVTRAGLRRVGLAVGFAIAVGGCAQGASPSGAAGASVADALGRPFLVHRPPASPPSRKIPLVVALHGFRQSPQRMADLTGMNRVADRYGFVAAYASSGDKPNWQDASWMPKDDVVYLRRLIDRLIARGGIDRRRVYVLGFSLGGSMTYRVACELATRVAAIAEVSGAMYVPRCHPARPVSVFSIVGDADPYVPLAGKGRTPAQAATSARWARLDRCRRRDPVRRAGVVERMTWRRCRGRRQVALSIIRGGVHQWPGGPGVSPSSPDGQFDASTAVWRFLSRFKQLKSSRPSRREPSAGR